MNKKVRNVQMNFDNQVAEHITMRLWYSGLKTYIAGHQISTLAGFLTTEERERS